MTELQIRTAATLGVRERIIDLIAVPYNEPTEVFRRDRLVVETIDPGAFSHVGGERIKVNRGHNPESPLGWVRKFFPGDPRGLRAELKITDFDEGNAVLALAEDGLLSASIGFMSLPGGEDWNHDRTAVKVTRAKLVHIAMTGDPAYEGAKVLAVRTADAPTVRTPTPNLDRIKLEMLVAGSGFDLTSAT